MQNPNYIDSPRGLIKSISGGGQGKAGVVEVEDAILCKNGIEERRTNQ